MNVSYTTTLTTVLRAGYIELGKTSNYTLLIGPGGLILVYSMADGAMSEIRFMDKTDGYLNR